MRELYDLRTTYTVSGLDQLGEDPDVLSGLSRRGFLLGAGSLAIGTTASGCSSHRHKPGSVLWHAMAPGGLTAVAESANVLCLIANGGTYGWSAVSGKEIWRLRGSQGAYLNVSAVGGPPFIVTNSAAIAALNPATGRRRWRFELPDSKGLPSVSLTAEDNDAVYATGLTAVGGKPRFYILAIDVANGERRWAAYFPPSAAIGPLSAGDGIVCALSGMSPGRLIALDARTGSHKWTTKAGVAPPLRADIANGVICGSVATESNTSSVVALRVSDGSVLWNVDVGGNLLGTVSDGHTAYASTSDGPSQDGMPGDLVALDARTGKTLWKRHYPSGPPAGLVPTGAVLYAATGTGDLHAMNATTGSVLWSRKIAERRKDELAAVIPTASGLYLANLNGALYSLQP